MRSPIVLEQESVAQFNIKRSAKDGEYKVQLQLKYEPDFLAFDHLTSDEAAELQGAKIYFKVWRANTALAGWLPLRRCKPTNALLYLYREAMSVLRLTGAAPKETAKKTGKNQKSASDDSGWDQATLLARARLLQSLADGRFYAKGYAGTSQWESKAGHKVKEVNVVDIQVPQKVGKWRKTSLRLGFLPFAGDRCHVWVKVGREGITVATRSQDQAKEPPPAPATFVAMPSPLGAVTQKLVDLVCASQGTEAAPVPSTRLKQLVEGTLSAPWHVIVEGVNITISAKVMEKLGVACKKPQGPRDNAQRFLWHLDVKTKVLRVARVEAPSTWVAVDSTEKRRQALRRACAKWVKP
jgi:hypothetical protein